MTKNETVFKIFVNCWNSIFFNIYIFFFVLKKKKKKDVKHNLFCHGHNSNSFIFWRWVLLLLLY